MNIKIKILNGTIITLDINSDNTIYKIKEQIQELEGIDLNKLNFMLNGTILNDTIKIKDCNINQNSILQLILKPYTN